MSSRGLAYKVSDDEVIMLRDKFTSDLEDDSGQKHHLLSIPVVYLVDDTDILGFQYSNPDFTVRLDSQELLRIAKQYNAKK